ncbi:MAG: hypothetical protein Tsb009_11380 [Planctomycetaceae bacterium]
MQWAVIIGMIAAAIVLIDALAHWISSGIVLNVFERQLPFKVQPSELHPNAELISFPTSDGLKLQGSLLRQTSRPPRGLILFCPELNGTHSSAFSYCQSLWDAGFEILAFDFRSQGQSDRLPNYQPLHWVTDYEIEDAQSAIRYAKSHPELADLPLGVMGISRGGGVALAVAAMNKDIQFVATEGAFSTSSLAMHYTMRWASVYVPQWVMWILPMWHIRTTFAIARWRSQRRLNCRYTRLDNLLPRLRKKHVLLISGMSDSYVPPSISEHLAECIGGSNCQIWKVRKARHNQARSVNPEQYDSKLVEFFSKMATNPMSLELNSSPSCQPADASSG